MTHPVRGRLQRAGGRVQVQHRVGDAGRAVRAATPPPSPAGTPHYGPCGSSCSDSNGDPHLLTVNQVPYDFQAAGEFTLLRSADGSVDIQARQEPFGDGRRSVSINTAIAAKVGSHRVGIYLTRRHGSAGSRRRQPRRPERRADGPGRRGKHLRLQRASTKGFEIDFPDGTKMWTLSVGEWGINAQILPSASLAASGVGLLGRASRAASACRPCRTGRCCRRRASDQQSLRLSSTASSPTPGASPTRPPSSTTTPASPPPRTPSSPIPSKARSSPWLT